MKKSKRNKPDSHKSTNKPSEQIVDLPYLQFIENTLTEWSSKEDDEAFKNL